MKLPNTPTVNPLKVRNPCPAMIKEADQAPAQMRRFEKLNKGLGHGEIGEVEDPRKKQQGQGDGIV